MAINRTKKESLVAEYSDLLQNSTALVFTDYRGSKVAQIQSVRNKMREHNTPFAVVKNTLLGLALRQTGVEIADEGFLTGPIAVAFVGEDIGQSVTALKDAIKDLEHININGGLMEGSVLDAEAAISLADLPTREQMLSTLLATILAPATSLARIIDAPGSSLARVINAHVEKQQEAA